MNQVERIALATAYLHLSSRGARNDTPAESLRDEQAQVVVASWIGAELGADQPTHALALAWSQAQVAAQAARDHIGGDGYLDVLQRAWRAVIPAAEKVSFDEVYALLRGVGLGELGPRLGPGQRPWDESGWHVHFVVGDYELWVFNDCGQWDYIDELKAVDGRTASFFDWLLDSPERQLARDEPALSRRMVRAFVRAK